MPPSPHYNVPAPHSFALETPRSPSPSAGCDTGDKPYKCQHCGDQFARSDLLLRHINKCHAAEKALAPSSAGPPGRRKGTTAPTRATTSKQACDHRYLDGLWPASGADSLDLGPAIAVGRGRGSTRLYLLLLRTSCAGKWSWTTVKAKCVARETRCTFVNFRRQTAPVGPGHPSSLSASSLSSFSSLPPSHPSASFMALPPLAPLSYPTLSLEQGMGAGIAGGGVGEGGQPTFLNAQQAESGAGFHGQSVFSANAPVARFRVERFTERFAHHPDGHSGGSRFAHHPGGGGSNAGSPTSAYADGSLPYNYPNPQASSGYNYAGEYAYDYADSEHSGMSGASVGGSLNGSVSGGSSPASSAGGDYGGAPSLPNVSASVDLTDMRHHPGDLHHPPEFSNALGLMTLDDPNVLPGLATDSVPFFSTAAPPAAGPTGLTPGVGGTPPPHPGPISHLSSGGGMGQQTPESREAETGELREFWNAYMRTPLTGPAGADALGMQTPSASAAASAGMLGATPTRESVGGNGTRRSRVVSLPSVKTPEGEMGAAPVYPMHRGARTMHNADDFASYAAAVLARKAPELVLTKPAGRPTTAAGVSTQVSPPPSIFEFGAAGRERGGAGALDGAAVADAGAGAGGQSNSLAAAFDFGEGYAAAPGAASQAAGNSQPTDSSFPGAPDGVASARASASANANKNSDGSSGEGGEASLSPALKRLLAQALLPQTKRSAGLGLGATGGESAVEGEEVECPGVCGGFEELDGGGTDDEE
ncbi:hypothetical protein B0H14DRAFT_2556022 [Mycena olivaceomarginata]|nr:hypothetical protein B0H14DRAFT_2556022 [Mycena olivaceomarginata]